MQTAAKAGFFDATDGLKLYAEWYLPEGTPRAGLIVCHGYGEHGGRYARLAGELAAHGFAVMAFDYRGHGQSGGTRGHCDHFDEFLGDLDRAIARARAALPDTPLGIIAHSHGGLIALRALCDAGRVPASVSAAVFSAPFLGLAGRSSPVKRAAAKILSRVAPRFSTARGLDPAWLSHAPEIVNGFETDRWNHHVATARWFMESSAAQGYIAAYARRVQIPTLWQLAGDDRIADTGVARRIFDAAGPSAEAKTLKVYEGLFHEIYNELERGPVVKDLVLWLSARFPAR